MTRTPAAHRLLTKKARQERALRRAMYRNPYFRVPMRWVTGAQPDLSADQMAEMMRHAPLMVIPDEPTYGYGPIAMTGVTAEEWAEHMRKVGQAYGHTAGEYSAGKRDEEGA